MAFPAPAPIGRTFEQSSIALLLYGGVLVFIQVLVLYALVEAALKGSAVGVGAAASAFTGLSLVLLALIRYRRKWFGA